MHAVGEEHETADRELALAPLGIGVDLIDQVDPFQASATGTCAPELFSERPTAMHAVDEAHETPNR
jgi:hypothetical protein